jgi:hypothetical protein
MAKVTGIGGVFFKSTGDHQALTAWYQRHLGIAIEPWGGAILEWPEDRAEDQGLEPLVAAAVSLPPTVCRAAPPTSP